MKNSIRSILTIICIALVTTACPTKTIKETEEITTVISAPQLNLEAQFDFDFGKTETEKSFTIKNSGGGPLTWSSSKDDDWLTLTPTSGEVEANQTIVIKLAIDRAKLSAGANSADISLRSQKDGSDIAGSPANITVRAFKVMLPTVQLRVGDLTNIQTERASAVAKITALGSSPVIEKGHVWSVTKGVSLDEANISKTALGEAKAVGTFSSSLTGLTAEKIYYVKAYAINAEGTSYSDELAFKTLQAPLVLSFVADDITAVGLTTATAKAI